MWRAAFGNCRTDARPLLLCVAFVAERNQCIDAVVSGPVFLAGAPVAAGLHGHTPSLTDLEDGDLKMSVDFRRVYATILDDWLNVPSQAALGRRFEKMPIIHALQ